MKCKRDSFSHLIKSHFTIIHCDIRRCRVWVCKFYTARMCRHIKRTESGKESINCCPHEQVREHSWLRYKTFISRPKNRSQSAKFSICAEVDVDDNDEDERKDSWKNFYMSSLCNYQSFIIEQLSTASNSINFTSTMSVFLESIKWILMKIWGRNRIKLGKEWNGWKFCV